MAIGRQIIIDRPFERTFKPLKTRWGLILRTSKVQGDWYEFRSHVEFHFKKKNYFWSTITPYEICNKLSITSSENVQ